ncbi:MAG: hypothetical protein ACK4ZM_04855, partial [bacterium]
EQYKDPAFFGKQYKNFLENLIGNLKKPDKKIYQISPNTLKIEISKEKFEIIKIYENSLATDQPENQIEEIIIAKGENLQTQAPIKTNKEITIQGNLSVNHPIETKALLVEGNININSNLKINYWIHVEGKGQINNTSILGINAFFKELYILSSCLFKRIFANKIIVGKSSNQNESLNESNASIFKGIIKAKKDITIKTQDKKLIIEGDLISDKSIIIEGDVWIKGNIFSHTGIVILNGATVGEENKIKSVIAKKRIVLINHCKIYGYLHTEGVGIVQI